MRCRKNVNSMSSQEKGDFARAIVLLKSESSVLHPGSQSRYDDYVEIHREAMGAAIFQDGALIDPGWAHFDSAFFPWHRELLYQFEEDLRRLVPNITIPYWDWTRDQQPGDLGWPFTHDFIGVEGTQSVNFQDGANNQVLREPINTATTPYPYEFDPATWSVAVRDVDDARPWAGLTRNFADEYDNGSGGSVLSARTLPDNDVAVAGSSSSFRDAINTGAYLDLRERSENIHNLVHRWVGGIVPVDLNNNSALEDDEFFQGDMLTSSSPNDPVFWLHHAAIDRMWSIWREKNPEQMEEFYYQHLNGFQGHGIDDDLIFHAPGTTSPFSGIAKPRQLINGHAQHGKGIWYESDLPEITQEGGATLNFGGVSQGLTQYRAIRFRVATCRPMLFRIIGAPAGNFGTPDGLAFPVRPDLNSDYVDSYVWLSYQANGGSSSSQVIIEAYLIDEEGYYAANEGGEYSLGTYEIDLEANTIPLENNAIVMVLDRSGSMASTAGGGITRSQLLKNAVEVFHTLMQPNDEIGIVSFDDAVEIPLPLTTQNSGLGATTTGNSLDPRGSTSIGLGILEGATMLNGATHSNRSILVLTDGNENVQPYVSQLPAATIHDRVYAIGLGLHGQVSDQVLNEITQSTQGDLMITGELTSADEEYLLSKYFIQILAGITSTSVVLDPHGELTWGQNHTIPFQLSDADISVEIILLSALAEFLSFHVITPTGDVITPQVALIEPNINFKTTNKIAFFRMLLPAIPSNPKGSHTGHWKVVLSLKDPEIIQELLLKEKLGREHQEVFKRGAISYNCIINARSNLQFAASVHQKTMTPGETLYLSSALTEYSIPHRGSATVWCEVIYPNGFLKDIRLKETDAGNYLNSLVAVEPGIYKLRFRAEGRTLSGYSFTREKILSTSIFFEHKHIGGVSLTTDELWKSAKAVEEVILRPQAKVDDQAMLLEALPPNLSKLLAHQLHEVGSNNLLRAPGVAVPIDPMAVPEKKRTKKEINQAKTHQWSPMKPSKDEIFKSFHEGVKIQDSSNE